MYQSSYAARLYRIHRRKYVQFFSEQPPFTCNHPFVFSPPAEELVLRDKLTQYSWVPELGLAQVFSKYIHPWRYGVPKSTCFKTPLPLRAIGIQNSEIVHFLISSGVSTTRHHQISSRLRENLNHLYHKRKRLWRLAAPI